MTGCLRTLTEVSESIRLGDVLLLAGERRLLERLPTGNWIGGTVPYLPGAEPDDELLHATTLPPSVVGVSQRVYRADDVNQVYADLADKGFGVIVVPASSPTHLEFALHAPEYRGFAVRPLVGWISGVQLDPPDGRLPRAYCGSTGEVVEDGAVVLQVTLAPGYAAEVGVVNVFEQGNGAAITFPRSGFDVEEAFVDGRPTAFAEYVRSSGLDTRLPLVADHYGIRVNVSFQAVDEQAGAVRFYSPVFAGVTYRHARPVGRNAERFNAGLPATWPGDAVFSCNCILNYFYAELGDKQALGVGGPLTFGEVAYQLLNQTMVYLTISRLGAPPPTGPTG
jgi:hypothetical protein